MTDPTVMGEFLSFAKLISLVMKIVIRYENADGSYKIETKYPTGEVYGKYGYIDDTGKLREVEYGASKRGFEPAGTDVTVCYVNWGFQV